ncbi:MAG: hypothetical protein ABI315_00735 [Bacteroidia bacterium]
MFKKYLIPQKRYNTNFVNTAGLLFITILSNSKNMFAQGEPSFDNVQKATEAARDQIRHDEIMSYLYMAIGFIAVIAIAWFTNARVQKRRSLEERNKRAGVVHHRNPHDPYRKAMPNTGIKKKLHKEPIS